MPSELLQRLNPMYTGVPGDEVMARAHAFPRTGTFAGFGQPLARVDGIVVHQTSGMPRRARANEGFRNRYLWTGTCSTCCDANSRCGIGTQFFISYDGTVFRLVELPGRTFHATYVTDWTLGVETGNFFDGTTDRGPQAGAPRGIASPWRQMSTDDQDIPGAKLWIDGDREALATWWTTPEFRGPYREPPDHSMMMFSEWQYRAWAALARYTTERQGLPRNFPLLPHSVRADFNTDSARFRRVVLADERADVLMRLFEAAPINIARVSFEDGNAAALDAQYRLANRQRNNVHREHNLAYRAFIAGDDRRPRSRRIPGFRGIHGHGFSGAINWGPRPEDIGSRPDDKQECPGALFDFFRFAREVWDWWWYPFDVEAGRTNVAFRGYRTWEKETPLLEYYWDESETARSERRVEGVHGARSSPATFRLDPASHIYALANGQLVAARFPTPDDGVSGAFMLVRHEVFHLPRPTITGQQAPRDGEIDFDRAPAYVYSLYYHLGRPAGMTFDAIDEHNPDWLNRILIRKKECDLGVAFFDGGRHGIANNVWANRPPGTPDQRPTALDGWRADQRELDTFLTALREGRTAVAPATNAALQPIRILLGDFLGDSGVIRREGGVTMHGVRVEVFATSFSPPGFHRATTNDWTPPPPPLEGPPSLAYRTEWVRERTPSQTAAMQAIGVNTAHLDWWADVASVSEADGLLPSEAKLFQFGFVSHVDPLDFMRWINEVTWRHEWPKYEVTDDAGNVVLVEDAAGNLRRPRSRRI